MRILQLSQVGVSPASSFQFVKRPFALPKLFFNPKENDKSRTLNNVNLFLYPITIQFTGSVQEKKCFNQASNIEDGLSGHVWLFIYLLMLRERVTVRKNGASYVVQNTKLV